MEETGRTLKACVNPLASPSAHPQAVLPPHCCSAAAFLAVVVVALNRQATPICSPSSAHLVAVVATEDREELFFS